MYAYLQPLSLCLSHKAIDDLCEDHDAVVKQWGDGMNIQCHSNGTSRDLEVEKDDPISVHGVSCSLFFRIII